MVGDVLDGKVGEKLRALYDELDADLARLDLACDGCGACCRFDEVDHILYASSLEVDYVFSVNTPGVAENPMRCPYQSGDACLAREGRVLGCRLHFCAAKGEKLERLEELSEMYHQKLKALCDDSGILWRYEPFLAAVKERMAAAG